MYYSDEIIEEVRSRNDIVDVISTYVKLQKKGSSYFGLCPGSITKSPLPFPSARQKQMILLFRGGAGGNVFTFLMEYENYSFVEALRYLADRAGVDLPEQEYSEAERRRRMKKRASGDSQTGSPVLLCTAKEFPGRAGNGISQGKAAWR